MAFNSLPTERQSQIINLMWDGLNTEEIAKRLKLSLKGVEFHRANIMRDWGVDNRVALIRRALELGILTVTRIEAIERPVIPRKVRTLKHGKSKAPEYRSWIAMRKRCTDPKSFYYHRYGGRGIKVCERWKEFSVFLSDMGPKPGPGYSIDRINVDGDYVPNNCRWATQTEQMRNTWRKVNLTVGGKTISLADYAKEIGVSYQTAYARLKSGTLFLPSATRENPCL